MAAAFVQSKRATATAASVSATFDTNVAAGSLVCVYVAWNDLGTVLSSVTVGGVTATLLDNPTDGATGRSAMAYLENVAGGATTVTATFNGVVVGDIAAHEVSGVMASGSLDGHKMVAQTAPGTGTDAVTTSPAITTTANGDYIFGATCDNNNDTQINAGTGYTLRVQAPAGGLRDTTEDKIQATAGSVTATFTDTNALANNITGIAAFKASGAPVDLLQGAMLVG